MHQIYKLLFQDINDFIHYIYIYIYIQKCPKSLILNALSTVTIIGNLGILYISAERTYIFYHLCFSIYKCNQTLLTSPDVRTPHTYMPLYPWFGRGRACWIRLIRRAANTNWEGCLGRGECRVHVGQPCLLRLEDSRANHKWIPGPSALLAAGPTPRRPPPAPPRPQWSYYMCASDLHNRIGAVIWPGFIHLDPATRSFPEGTGTDAMRLRPASPWRHGGQRPYGARVAGSSRLNSLHLTGHAHCASRGYCGPEGRCQKRQLLGISGQISGEFLGRVYTWHIL